MTVDSSPVPRSHCRTLQQRMVLQLAFAAFGALPVYAHDEGAGAYDPPPPPDAPPPSPHDLPPPPADVRVQANVRTSAPQPPASPVDGQWVHTQQYGWVWMPYEQSYTHVPAQGDPVMFVYGSSLGWRWVAAPWVFEYGPTPYWGVRGRAHFSWHSRPWFVRRAYRPVYREARPVYREARPVYRRDYREARRDYRRDVHYRREARRDNDWRGRQAREDHGRGRGHGHGHGRGREHSGHRR
jgi:hypothetical protein